MKSIGNLGKHLTILSQTYCKLCTQRKNSLQMVILKLSKEKNALLTLRINL